jgi:hypothetical protein
MSGLGFAAAKKRREASDADFMFGAMPVEWRAVVSFQF